MKYRKVDPRIWNDRKFSNLSDDGKLVFLFVLTHPHMTALGAMRANTQGLAVELGWPHAKFAKAFGEVLAKALLEYDGKASCLAAPNFLKYNRPESPNVIKAWESALDLVPECPLKALITQRVKDFTEGLTEGFKDALPEAFAKALRIQEQEQEQEQEQDSSPKPPSSRGLAKRVFGFWQQQETLVSHRGLTPGISEAISKRHRKGYSYDQITMAIQTYARLCSNGGAPGYGKWGVVELMTNQKYFDRLLDPDWEGFSGSKKPKGKSLEELEAELEDVQQGGELK